MSGLLVSKRSKITKLGIKKKFFKRFLRDYRLAFRKLFIILIAKDALSVF